MDTSPTKTSTQLRLLQAQEICETAGARLCTNDELKADETHGSGCNYDFEWVWSSTPCSLGSCGESSAGDALFANNFTPCACNVAPVPVAPKVAV
jgi:hypothetical protein